MILVEVPEELVADPTQISTIDPKGKTTKMKLCQQLFRIAKGEK